MVRVAAITLPLLLAATGCCSAMQELVFQILRRGEEMDVRLVLE